MTNAEKNEASTVEVLLKRIAKLQAENKNLKEKYQNLMDTTFQGTQRMSPMALREALIKQMGKKAYLKKLLTDKKGHLWTVDKQMLLEMLDGKEEKEVVKAEAETE